MSEDSREHAAGKLTVDVSETGPDASEWLAALEQLGCDQPSQTPGYFAALRAELAGTDSRPFVCTVRGDDRVRGIAIVVEGPVSIRFKLGERTLLSIPVPGMRLVDPQPVLADDQAAEALFNALAGLDHHMLVLERYNPVEGPWRRLADSQPLRNRYNPYIAFGITETCAVQPEGSWDDHLKSLGRKIRHELQRKDERIKREYGDSEVVLQRVESLDQIGWFQDAVRAVYSDSWQGKRKVTQRSFADSRAYLEVLARQGLLVGYVLTVRAEPIAFAYGVKHGTHCHLKEMAYNQRYKSASPGQVLVSRVMRDLFDHQGMRLCSLGYGNARYKKEICNRSSPVAMLWLPRKSSFANLVVTLHKFWTGAQAGAGAMLERFSIKQEVLTWLRSG